MPSGTGASGHGEHGLDPIRKAQVEQHPLRKHAVKLAGLQIYDEQSLAADDLLRIRTFLLQAGDDVPVMVAEMHPQLDETLRAGDVFHGLNGTNADVELFQQLRIDGGLDGCGSHGGILSAAMVDAPRAGG